MTWRALGYGIKLGTDFFYMPILLLIYRGFHNDSNATWLILCQTCWRIVARGTWVALLFWARQVYFLLSDGFESLFASVFTSLTLSFLSFSIHTHPQTISDTFYRISEAKHFSCGRRACGPAEVSRPKRLWQMLCFVGCPQGDSLRTSIQLDFGDGIKITYSNLSRTDDGIKHIYRTTGIYRVTASAENRQGSDSSTLFLHITSMWITEIITHSCSSAWSMNFTLPHRG